MSRLGSLSSGDMAVGAFTRLITLVVTARSWGLEWGGGGRWGPSSGFAQAN